MMKPRKQQLFLESLEGRRLLAITLKLQSSSDHEIAHVRTSDTVTLDVGRLSNIYDAGDTDLDVVSSRFDLIDGGQEGSDDYLDVDVDILSPRVTSVGITNLGNLEVVGRGLAARPRIVTVPDEGEEGDIIMRGTFDGMFSDMLVDAANDIVIEGRFNEGERVFARLTLRFGGDLRFTETSVYDGIELPIEPQIQDAPKLISRTFLSFRRISDSGRILARHRRESYQVA